MGQRSQIYIRFPHKKYLIARYFQWNYGERMISRARGIAEKILSYKEYDRYWDWSDNELHRQIEAKKFRRICDVNFDFRDITLSTNICKEFFEMENDWKDFNVFTFEGQDNNDGQLFIDVQSDGSIKYCLTDSSYKFGPFNALEYLLWDDDSDEFKLVREEARSININSEKKIKEIFEMVNLHMDEETFEYTISNLQFLQDNENISLMTREEMLEFINYPYSKELVKEEAKWE